MIIINNKHMHVIQFTKRLLDGSNDVIYALISRGVIVFISFSAMLILAWLMKEDEYGIFVLYWSISLVIGSLLSLGGPVYLLKEMALSADGDILDRSHTMRLIAVTPGAMAIVALIIVSILPDSLLQQFLPAEDQNKTVNLNTAILMGFLLNYSGCMCSILHGLGFINTSMFVRDAVPQAAILVVATVASLIFSPSTTFVLATAAAVMLLVTLAETAVVYIQSRRLPLIGRRGRRGTYNLHYWSGSLLGVLWAQLDILVGSFVLSSEQLGIYNIIRRVCNLIALPMTVVTWLTVGTFSRAFRDADYVLLAKTARASLLIAILPGLLLAIVVALSVRPVEQLYGLTRDTDVALAWWILSVQALINLMFAPVITIGMTSGLEKQIVMARLIGAATFIGSVLVLGMVLSGLALNAAALIMGTLLLNIYPWLIIRRQFGLDGSVLALVK